MKSCPHRLGPLPTWVAYPPVIGKMFTCLLCGALKAGRGTVTVEANHVELTVAAAPANPASGSARLYVPTSATARIRDSAGVETELATPPEARAAAGGTTHYSIPGVEASVQATQTTVVNNVLYAPLYVVKAITIDQIACEVTVAGAGSVRGAVYNADTDWQPTSLVVDTGNISVSTTGVKTATVSITLQPGRYVSAFNANISATMRIVSGGSRYFGYRSTLGATLFIESLYAAQTFGAFPDPGLAWDTVFANTVPPRHYLFYRISVP